MGGCAHSIKLSSHTLSHGTPEECNCCTKRSLTARDSWLYLKAVWGTYPQLRPPSPQKPLDESQTTLLPSPCDITPAH